MKIIHNIYAISETHSLTPKNQCSTHLEQGEDMYERRNNLCIMLPMLEVTKGF